MGSKRGVLLVKEEEQITRLEQMHESITQRLEEVSASLEGNVEESGGEEEE